MRAVAVVELQLETLVDRKTLRNRGIPNKQCDDIFLGQKQNTGHHHCTSMVQLHECPNHLTISTTTK